METLRRTSSTLNTQNQEIHVDSTSLTLLINRLEAATSRLEDIASSAVSYDGDAATNGAPPAPATSAKGVPSAAASVAAAGASPTPKPAAAKVALPPMIEDLDTLMQGDLKAYEKLSNASALGGLVGEQVSLAVQDHFDRHTHMNV
jgi:adenylyl cyclase-associated protein